MKSVGGNLIWLNCKRCSTHSLIIINNFNFSVGKSFLGHDSGMIVFKLERERPAYAVHGNTLYYTKVCWMYYGALAKTITIARRTAKSNRIRLAKKQLCTSIILISCFIKDVNMGKLFNFSFSELRYCLV